MLKKSVSGLPMPNLLPGQLDSMFLALLRERGVPPASMDVMMRDLNDKAKWQYLQSNGDVNAKGKKSKKGKKSIRMKPSFFIHQLSASPDVDTLQSLRVCLTTEPLSWVNTFMASTTSKKNGMNGVALLLHVLEMFERKRPRERNDAQCLTEVMLCLMAVMQTKVGVESVLEVAGSVRSIAMVMSTVSHRLRRLVFSLLSALCQISIPAYVAVVEALDYYKSVRREPVHYLTLVDTLKQQPDRESAAPCLLLINSLISTPDELDDRMSMRTCFIRLGIKPAIEHIVHSMKGYPDFKAQADIFYDDEEEDVLQLKAAIGDETGVGEDGVSETGVPMDAEMSRLQAEWEIQKQSLLLAQQALQQRLQEEMTQRVALQQQQQQQQHQALPVQAAPSAQATQQLMQQLQHVQAELVKTQEVNKALEGRVAELNMARSALTMSLAAAESQKGDLAKQVETHQAKIKELEEQAAADRDEPVPAPAAPPAPVAPAVVTPPPPPAPAAPAPPPAPPAPSIPGAPAPPPAPGIPGPPPPPAGLGAGFRLLGTKLPPHVKDIPKPATRTKQFNWSKIPNRLTESTIWAKISTPVDTLDMDWKEVESRFVAKAPASLAAAASKAPKKPQQIRLLDPKRAQSVAIFLKSFRKTPQQVRDAIERCDQVVLDEEQLPKLVLNAPTAEEQAMLRDFADGGGDVSLLDVPGQFYLCLADMKLLAPRLKAWQLVVQLDDHIAESQPKAQVLQSALKQIHSSSRFRRVLEVVLALGNFLNGKSSRGSAIGFQLQSLTKLGDTKTADGKDTLLHYLVDVLERKHKDALIFADDLTSVKDATRVSFQTVQSDARGIERDYKQATASMERVAQAAGAAYAAAIPPRLAAAKPRVDALVSLVQDTLKTWHTVAEAYGEDAQKVQAEAFVGMVNTFMNQFKKAREEVMARRLAEERRQAKLLARLEAAETLRGHVVNAPLAEVEQKRTRDELLSRRAADAGLLAHQDSFLENVMSNLRNGSAFNAKRTLRAKARIATLKNRRGLLASQAMEALAARKGPTSSGRKKRIVVKSSLRGATDSPPASPASQHASPVAAASSPSVPSPVARSSPTSSSTSSLPSPVTRAPASPGGGASGSPGASSSMGSLPVSPVSPPPLAAAAAAPAMYAVGSFDFTGGTAGMLPFAKGERLQVLAVKGDWWRARNAKGVEGMIPANYVRLETKAQATPPSTGSPKKPPALDYGDV